MVLGCIVLAGCDDSLVEEAGGWCKCDDTKEQGLR